MVVNFPVVLVGLGNPGAMYEYTRHNIGRRFLYALADAHGVQFQRFKNAGFVAWIKRDGGQTALFYPEGYMNNSGTGIGEFMRYYRMAPESLCVIHDELERKVGVCHLKSGGSARGHNGIKHSIATVGSSFWRLGIGIDHPRKLGLHHSVSDYVLSAASDEHDEVLSESIESLLQSSDDLVNGDFEAMKIVLDQQKKIRK